MVFRADDEYHRNARKIPLIMIITFQADGLSDMIRGVKLNFLVEDTVNPENPDLWPEHGLSILIEVEYGDGNRGKILFDTGTSGKALEHNVRLMDVSLRDVASIVLSHGHYDHTGGLLAALNEIKPFLPIPIVAHPDALRRKFALKPYLRFTGIPFTEYEIESRGGRFMFSSKPLEVVEDVFSTGEVERTTGFEKSPEYYVMLKNGEIVRDYMLDDQAVVIKQAGKGLVVVTGCAHAGVVNTVRYARKFTGEEKVHAVIGGFHLIGASAERIEKTVEELKKINPDLIAPCHCTGERAVEKMREAFGERLIEVHVGSTIEL